MKSSTAQELLSSYRCDDTRVLLVVPFDDRATMDDGVRLTGSAQEVGKPQVIDATPLFLQLHTCHFGRYRMRSGQYYPDIASLVASSALPKKHFWAILLCPLSFPSASTLITVSTKLDMFCGYFNSLLRETLINS